MKKNKSDLIFLNVYLAVNVICIIILFTIMEHIC